MLSKLRILLSLLMLSKLGKYIRHRFVPYNTTIQDHHTIKLQTFSCPFSFSNPQASHFIVLCSCMVVLYGTNLCLMYFQSLDSINRLTKILNSLFYVYFTVFVLTGLYFRSLLKKIG